MKSVSIFKSGRKTTSGKLFAMLVIVAMAAVCVLTPSMSQAADPAPKEAVALSASALPAVTPEFTLTPANPPLSAKAGAVGLPGGATWTTRTVYSDLKIPFTAVAATPLPFRLYADEKVNGVWENKSWLDYNALAGEHYLYATDIANGLYSKWLHLPGATTWRLRQGTYITTPDAVSPDFTVNFEKTQTSFVVGSAEKASFVKYGSKRYFEVKKKKIEARFVKAYPGSKRIALQRLTGSTWKEVDYVNWYGQPDLVATIDIVQEAATCKYRLFVPGDDYVTGGASPTFTVSGTKQKPQFTLKYSASSQKYKKTAVKVSVAMLSSSARSGKITIYDGKKALKTVTLKNGKASWSLPKTLKKGTHSIKVKYTPTGDDKVFYNTRTSAVKKIKVS